MRPRRLTPPVRRTTRRWRTPPALLHGSEAFEGAEILEEAPAPLGVLLFHLIRDVYLWGQTPPDERDGLFAGGADEAHAELMRTVAPEPALESALLPLLRLTGAPGDTRPEVIALACRNASQWADARGWTATAIAFAQGVAVVLPGDAGASYAVGRLARRRAEHARAETWFRRAVSLARQSGDWTAYTQAFSGLGNLYLIRGNLPAARRFHLRSLRAARRHSLRDMHASALHDLFVIAAQSQQPEDAERMARAAFALYGAGHRRLPYLAGDVACFWMDNGRFEQAQAVFHALAGHMDAPDDREVALSNLARAAAGSGDRRAFEQAWTQAWRSMDGREASEHEGSIALELARGAAMLGDSERAEAAASRALRVATDRGESRTRLAAEAVLDQARRQRAVRTAEAAAPRAPEPPEEFALDLARALAPAGPR
ncbi:tetratricopeptide repeat protein [Longimicrobium terrae]|uniref:Tetratricopeptide (TPR) repeat protein n=1 Tax=Longimicrobium terrae TaxID=1639882 RepID=A0A841H2D5_9BACT|nr:tetratricopeptide repeat protein [Longimicrobium terrae]MBB4637737.1 tetratricopeptide (TPR) repeat protein [Longimicrobium terrae]MBB6072134.1 tetratricopeptide (TPR) repeat protein [Longimicrobium terrae]NNC29784.1 tetratricopeptide repeat protein [Longimicrobium terrae]